MSDEISIARGQEEIREKAARLRVEMYKAASVALVAIEENEKAALEKIKQEAGERRGKIKKQIQDIDASSDMKIISKLWHTKHEELFLHFIGDGTRVGGFGATKE